MKQTKILVLDFHSMNGLGNILSRILKSTFPGGLQFAYKFIDPYESNWSNLDLYGIIGSFNPDLIFTIFSPCATGQADALFRSLKSRLKIPFVVISEACEPQEIFALLKKGAADFITPPLRAGDILPRIWRVLETAQTEETLINRVKKKLGLRKLVGNSHKFLDKLEQIPLLASCNATVMITGETGTGKELFARTIHYSSSRASCPFVPINCGAIPIDLVENELFGHEPGAYTGAMAARQGLISEAHRGTLFLDEIDCLPASAQVKLLRFLQEKEYRPLGSNKMREADVRVIAATNIELEKAVTEGRFRRDLYYRLNILPLNLPPLREIKEDIPLLAKHFLGRYSGDLRKPDFSFSPDAMKKLLLYDWPGNVRELEHVVERAVLFSRREVIEAADIVFPLLGISTLPGSFQEAKRRLIAQFEQAYIRGVLLAHQGNITRAAKTAQKNRRAFWELIRKHHIDVQSLR